MYRRGDVLYASLEGIGSEQKGIMPVVIIQNDAGNDKSNTIIVAPVGKRKKPPCCMHFIFYEKEGGIRKDSVLMCEQIKVIDKSRVLSKIGYLSQDTMLKINKKIKRQLGL